VSGSAEAGNGIAGGRGDDHDGAAARGGGGTSVVVVVPPAAFSYAGSGGAARATPVQRLRGRRHAGGAPSSDGSIVISYSSTDTCPAQLVASSRADGWLLTSAAAEERRTNPSIMILAAAGVFYREVDRPARAPWAVENLRGQGSAVGMERESADSGTRLALWDATTCTPRLEMPNYPTERIQTGGTFRCRSERSW